MTEEKLAEINDIRTKIGDKRRSLRKIEDLMTKSDLCCKISGNPRKVGLDSEYYSLNQEGIINLLRSDKIKIENELSELLKVFSEM